MKRRTFLTSLSALFSLPFISKANSDSIPDRLKLSHHYPGAYHDPNDLWTPDEITESGFVFVEFPTFIHRFDDPYHPIMKSYCKEDSNFKPMIAKTSRYCGVRYLKEYFGKKEWRGMYSVGDYLSKKDIFKPMILEWMKKMEYHYVYKVSLEESPCIWHEKDDDSKFPSYHYMHALNVRGCRLPKKL